ncbi:hypothetical protein [Deinococcus sp.]|uniref:hypothetical protein n=1 Tax=Deinococcus sp. TaxID=47478 RepID=UPI0025C4C14D|nr:hypothetical protein [Deinococcus sp.]
MSPSIAPRRASSLLLLLAGILALGLCGCKPLAEQAPQTAPPPEAGSVRTVALLQVYPNFAEVRAPVQITGQSYTLAGDTDPYLLTDTANLEGVSVLSSTLTGSEGWLSSLEGQHMTLYVGGKPKDVTLIRARDLLVKDWNGKYRRIQASHLAFDTPPPLTGQNSARSLTFQVERPGHATLTYLTRGLGWSPRYTLNIQGDTAVLTALADIRNPGDQVYQVGQTELVSGDVNVYGANAGSVSDEATAATAQVSSSAPMPVRTGNAVVAVGELRGLHRFRLERPFALRPRSTTSLPFLTPKITPERLNTVSTYFGLGDSGGAAQRSYRLKADAYLPAGPVLIRDEGHVVGQTGLNETAARQPIVLSVGEDPELTYTRTASVVQRDKTGAAYKVVYVLKNAKTQPARVRVTENLGALSGRVVTLSGDAVKENADATLAAELPAGGRLTRTLSIDARIRTQK